MIALDKWVPFFYYFNDFFKKKFLYLGNIGKIAIVTSI
jgi:hypothetical protein